MQVTIVIPNYNGKHFMKPCLESLDKQTYRGFEIIVVDNASSDGSMEYMKETYPEIRCIALDKNYGFSRAVNEGIRASRTPYVILLNNDTLWTLTMWRRWYARSGGQKKSSPSAAR